MAETSGPGEPMEVEEEVERVAQNGGAGVGAGVGVGVGGTNGGLMESSGPAAAPLLPPPPPPSNPVQNAQPQLSITPVSRSQVPLFLLSIIALMLSSDLVMIFTVSGEGAHSFGAAGHGESQGRRWRRNEKGQQAYNFTHILQVQLIEILYRWYLV